MTHTAPTTGKTTAAKAIVGATIGAAIAGLSSLAIALDDAAVSAQEGIYVAIATLTALGGVYGGVYATTNNPKP